MPVHEHPDVATLANTFAPVQARPGAMAAGTAAKQYPTSLAGAGSPMGHPKKQRQALALTLALVAWAAQAMAAAPKTSGCLIEPEQTADVGTPVTGVIEEMPAKLGDEVHGRAAR
jgi:hypothetical protein